MKHLILLLAAAATAATSWGAKGDVDAEGWLNVEDFEAATTLELCHPLNGNGIQGTHDIIDDPVSGGTHGKVARVQKPNWQNFIKVTITLPAGKTISNYSKIGFDYYRYSDDGNYKVLKGGIYTKDNDSNANPEIFNVNNGNMPGNGEANEQWLSRSYDIPNTITTDGNTFMIWLGVDSNSGHYCIDNIRLLGQAGDPGVGGNEPDIEVSFSPVVDNCFWLDDLTNMEIDEAFPSVLVQGDNADEPYVKIIADPTDAERKVIACHSTSTSNNVRMPLFNLVMPNSLTLNEMASVSFEFYIPDGAHSGGFSLWTDFVDHDTKRVLSADANQYEQYALDIWTPHTFTLPEAAAAQNAPSLRSAPRDDDGTDVTPAPTPVTYPLLLGVDLNGRDYYLRNVRVAPKAGVDLYVSTGVENVVMEESEGVVTYYDLQGRNVGEPSGAGIYIRRQGHKVSKILIR